MGKLLFECLQSLSFFISPPFCLSCRALSIEKPYLCPSCTELLEWILPQGRCPHCFLPTTPFGLCVNCQNISGSIHYMGAVFPHESPAKLLIDLTRETGAPALMSLLGSFFVVQYEQLGWDWPDYLLLGDTLQTKALCKEAGILLGKAFSRPCYLAKSWFRKPTPLKGVTPIILILDTHFLHRDDYRDWDRILAPLTPKKVFLLSFLDRPAHE